MDTYNVAPISLNREGKNVTVVADPSLGPVMPGLQAEIDILNKTYAAFQSAQNLADGIPPPPDVPFPKRSANVEKLREDGNGAQRAGDYVKAARRYEIAIAMSAGRPPWEPASLTRQELAVLHSNRAQTNLQLKNWTQALADARTSITLDRLENVRAWWRGGRALIEMGRLAEAKEWLTDATSIYRDNTELTELLASTDAGLAAAQKVTVEAI